MSDIPSLLKKNSTYIRTIDEYSEEFINIADAQQNRHIKINTKLEMEKEEKRKRAEKNKI